MNLRQRWFTALVVVGMFSLLAVVFLARLDPSILAAASGWYGYGGNPVYPEPTSDARPFHGVKERNSAPLHATGPFVQYLNGILKYRADGISIPSPGFSFSHRPTYNNNHANGTDSSSDGNINLPNGWNWHTGLFQLVDIGSSEVVLVGRGTASTKYKDNGYGTYAGQMGVDAKIVHDTSAKEMVLHASNGTTVKLHDFDSSHGDRFGALKEIILPSGESLTVDYYTYGENSNLEDLVEKVTDTGGHDWVYTYIDDTGDTNNRKLEKVEAKDGSTVLARIEFLYYDSTSGAFASGSGTNGDLMRTIVTRRDSNDLNLQRTTLFRYETGTKKHKLKYIVGPQGYEDLDASVSDPLKATDTEVEDHADYKLAYNSSSFITSATIRGGGCSCDGADGTYTFSYSTNGSWTPSSDFDTWKVSVTQTNPDGSVRVVDVNGAGSIINDILQTDASYGAGDQRWMTFFDYDSDGRVVGIARPSACSSYSNHSITLETSSGLIEDYSYDSNGNLLTRKIKEGTSGTLYWLEKNAYVSKTLGSNTNYFRSSRKVYRAETTTDTGADETQFSYVFHPDADDLDGDSNTTEDSLLVKEITVTHPAVATAENGDNSSDTQKHYFNTLGQLEWEKDEEGSITYRAYHADLGSITEEMIDLDTDGFSPTPPTGYTNSIGLSLQTTYFYQADGKQTEVEDPEGRSERYHYTHLSGGESVVLRYPHVDATNGPVGPVSIRIFDFDGALITKSKGVPSDGDDNLDDDFDELQSTLEAAFAGDLYQRTEYVYSGGQKTAEDLWTDAESGTATKYVTSFGYDDMGRLARVKDAEGTITRTYYTLQGRASKRDVGTNDYLEGDDLGEPTGTNNMTTVEELFYDGEESSSSAVGDGNLTRRKLYVDGSNSRDTDYTYDWRNRRVTADGEESFFEKLDHDNQDRVTVRYRYEGSESAANLRTKSETKYDSRGQVYESIVYEVSPVNGAIDDSLTTESWYDGRGILLKRRAPSGVFTKSQFDGAGRVESTFISFDTDETAYSEADDVAGDTVVAQTDFTRDAVGNITLETRWERKSTGTDTGELTTSKAVRYYVASWYDLIHRLDATADYGTNGGSDLTDYDPDTAGTQSYDDGPPVGSDTVLLTTYTFNDQGQGEDTVDPGGETTRKEYDNLGRTTAIIANYVNGTPGPNDDDRKQELVYNGVSQVTKRKVWMTGTSDVQETEYVYGVTKGTAAGDSDIASNSVLERVKYADPSSGSPSTSADDQESFAYNAQGDLIWRKDQNGVVHEYTYDEIGRRTSDAVTTSTPLPENIDDAVLRIGVTYDALDRLKKVTSYDAATGGNVENEVEYTYNGFGQVTEEKQEHAGAVDGSTLKVIATKLIPPHRRPW